MNPPAGKRLVVVIDTEEDWVDEVRRVPTLKNLGSVEGFYRRHLEPQGVRPLYVVNYPVASDPQCQGIFRELVRSQTCELGAHVHNWTSPPFTDDDLQRRSYHHTDIPEGLERQKIEDVTRLIENHMEVRPRCFKGGRWGAGGRTLRTLKALGYWVDASVHPLTDFRADRGPDYLEAPLQPYFPSEDDIQRPASDPDRGSDVLELPATVGFTRPGFARRQQRFAGMMRSPVARALRLVGLAHRTGLARRVKLSPESATGKEMIRLVDAALEDGQTFFNLTFHSCILTVGTSPYSQTETEIAQRLQALGEVLDHMIRQRGIQPVTPSEYRATWVGASPSPSVGD